MLNLWKARLFRRIHVFLKVLRHPWILLSRLLIMFNCALVFSSSIIPIFITHIVLYSWVVSGLRTIWVIWMVMSIPRLLNRPLQKAIMLLGLSSSVDCCRGSIRVGNFITSKRHHSSVLIMVPTMLQLFDLFILVQIIKITSRSSSFSKNFHDLL